MLLVVPNGKVKLLNALPFAPADLRRDSLAHAWQAYKRVAHGRGPRIHRQLPRPSPPASTRERNVADGYGSSMVATDIREHIPSAPAGDQAEG